MSDIDFRPAEDITAGPPCGRARTWRLEAGPRRRPLHPPADAAARGGRVAQDARPERYALGDRAPVRDLDLPREVVVTAPARGSMMPPPNRSISWDPAARVPDWVVLGRIRERLVAGLPVPESLCRQAEVEDYIPALLAAGHTVTEIEKLTGVRADRTHRRTR